MSLLNDAEIAARLSRLTGWAREGNTIRRRYTFPSFAAAIAFVSRIAPLADAADHHPDMLIEYRNVTLTLTTHDKGGLTARDFDLAETIDA